MAISNGELYRITDPPGIRRLATTMREAGRSSERVDRAHVTNAISSAADVATSRATAPNVSR
jgi:hypothetical protein